METLTSPIKSTHKNMTNLKLNITKESMTTIKYRKEMNMHTSITGKKVNYHRLESQKFQFLNNLNLSRSKITSWLK
jgi:hypothetical protein